MQLIFINKLPKNSGIYLQFSMMQEKTVKIICPAILNRINTNTVLSQYRESENHSPTFKEYAFRLINGVVRVREFAYYEYGY